MQRRMNIPTRMNAIWEIISTAEYIDDLDRNVNNNDMVAIYQGNYVPLMLDGRASRKQVWHVVITTVAVHEDGTEHTHEMEWQFDKPMLMKEVLDGAKHIKVLRSGIKSRWLGLAKEWTRTVDEDLYGLTAMSAWAVATCDGYIAKASPMIDVYSIKRETGKDIDFAKTVKDIEFAIKLASTDPAAAKKRLNANRNYLSKR